MKRIVCVAVLAIASIGCSKAPKIAVATQATVDGRNTNYKPGAGAIVNSARAGKRVAVLNDFDQLRTFIYAFELENNRMPTPEQLRGELRTAANIQKLIDEGAIIVPTPIMKDGVWAYEVDADKVGGILIVAGNVMRVTGADDVKKYLGQ